MNSDWLFGCFVVHAICSKVPTCLIQLDIFHLYLRASFFSEICCKYHLHHVPYSFVVLLNALESLAREIYVVVIFSVHR
jgi:hypothetical protein